jgi:TolB-like protein/tetratricopeptide (TPR) repeat protein
MKQLVDSEYGLKPAPQDSDCAPQPLPCLESIQAELERILSSRTFRAAEGQKRFLRFAVEHTIAGFPHEVKEYTVGVEVFGRGQAFDPRLDNIVRAEARKLRSRLAKYYVTEGEHDSVRIEFPSRGYVPAFREVDLSRAETPQEAVLATLEPEEPKVAEEANLPDESRKAPAKADDSSSVVPTYPARPWLRIVLISLACMITGIVIYAARLGWSSKMPPARNPSVAVLPFRNLGDTNDESFSDGLTDELINSLGRVQGLDVVARRSAFQFRNNTLDIREIGRKLNVRTVLEGSVRIYGNRLRITAELDDTSNGYRIWSDSYDRDFKDVLFVQRDISRAIVTALGAEFARDGTANLLKFSPAKIAAVDAEAYQDYLRGVYFWNKQTSDSIQVAIGYFEQAIAKDPGYALAYTGLARCYVNMLALTRMRAREVVPKIAGLAQKVLELDSSLGEPHLALAYASFLNYDWARAETEFKKGLELSPGDAVAHRWYVTYLTNAGRLREALAESEKSQQLDPVSPYMLDGTARVLYFMRRYDEVIEQSKKTLALEPQFGFAHLRIGTAYLLKRMYPEAIAELQVACQQMPNSPSPAAELAYTYAVSGNVQKARDILRGFLEVSTREPFPPHPIAKVYIGLGDKDSAFEWLGKAVEARDFNLNLKVDPIYDSLRSDPRYAQLLQRANLTPR